MKRLGLALLLALGTLAPACSTTAQWENQLDRYRSGRLDPHPTRSPRRRLDLRTDEERMSAQIALDVGQALAEVTCYGLFIFFAAL